jgi:hypothetical protein
MRTKRVLKFSKILLISLKSVRTSQVVRSARTDRQTEGRINVTAIFIDASQGCKYT